MIHKLGFCAEDADKCRDFYKGLHDELSVSLILLHLTNKLLFWSKAQKTFLDVTSKLF